MASKDKLEQQRVIEMLFESAMVLNEESAVVCLALAALALERGLPSQSVIITTELLKNETPFDASVMFSLSREGS